MSDGTTAGPGPFSILRLSSGDINAGFAFLLDCVVNLFVLTFFLSTLFGFPLEFILDRIIPGALLGLVVGNILNIRMALRIARETNNPNVTAMPLGLDLPTTIGISIFVVGPVFLSLGGADGGDTATYTAWAVGMAACLWMGLIKFGLSFVAGTVQRLLPTAALLGAMVGIAVVWLGANAILEIFKIPEVGFVALGIMMYALIASHKMPIRIPGAVVAILVGTALYYALGLAGMLPEYRVPDISPLAVYFPIPTLAGPAEMFGGAMAYIAVIIPFAILITASAINLATGAKVVGDDVKPGELIRVDSVATIVGALFGNIVQTTPYFGHVTYKRLGAKVGYSAAVVAVLAIGGMFGIIRLLIDVLPGAAITPILIVVACDIVRLSYQGVNANMSPAIGFAAMPAIMNFAHVKVSELMGHVANGSRDVVAALPPDWLQGYALLGAMSRGYILTSLLWAATVAFVIERRMIHAGVTLLVAGGMSIFGIIHSVRDDSAIYLPWQLASHNLSPYLVGLPYRLAGSYLLAALVMFVFAWFGEKSNAVAPQETTD